MTTKKRFYVVRGTRRGGTSTYNCPTPDWAWRKFQDFTQAEYANITVADPDGRLVTPGELEALVNGVLEPKPAALVPQV